MRWHRLSNVINIKDKVTVHSDICLELCKRRRTSCKLNILCAELLVKKLNIVWTAKKTCIMQTSLAKLCMP